MSDYPYLDSSQENYSSEYTLRNLSDVPEWKTWKSTIEWQMLDLAKRVSKLEPKRRKSFLPGGRVSAFSTAVEDGFCGLCTCVRLVRGRKAALLQCIWLILFMAVFASIGSREFLRAKENVETEFKPEKKLKTVNYYENQEEQIYEMPYISLYFFLWDWEKKPLFSNEVRNDTMQKILESQKSFNLTSITYVSRENYLWEELLPIEEATASCLEGSILSYGCFGYLRLKPSDLKTTNSYFEVRVPLNIHALGSTIGFTGLWVSVEKHIATRYWGDWVYVSADNVLRTNLSHMSIIDYQERIVHKLNNEDDHLFSTSLEWYDQVVSEGGWLNLTFKGNLMVEHWAEYVEYGYFDCFSGMCGIISMSSIPFLWGAYYLAVFFGDKKHMGILPQISFIFDNFERIHLATDGRGKP